MQLRAEPSTDVRSDDPQTMLIDVQDLRQHPLHDVRRLARQMDGHSISRHVVGRVDGARLHRPGDEVLVAQPLSYDDVGLPPCRRIVSCANRYMLQDVAANRCSIEFRVNDRGTRLGGAVGIGDCSKNFVVDIDRLKRVGGNVSVGGHHESDALTDISRNFLGEGAVLRQRHSRPDPIGPERPHVLSQIRTGEHLDDTRHGLRPGDIDPPDPGMRVRTAENGQMKGVLTARHDVIGEPAPAQQMMEVLATSRRPTKLAGIVRPGRHRCVGPRAQRGHGVNIVSSHGILVPVQNLRG